MTKSTNLAYSMLISEVDPRDPMKYAYCRLVNETDTEITIHTAGMEAPGVECIQIRTIDETVMPPGDVLGIDAIAKPSFYDGYDGYNWIIIFENGREEPVKYDLNDPRTVRSSKNGCFYTLQKHPETSKNVLPTN